MKISKYFQLHEFLRSNTAKKKGYTEQNNPSQIVIDNLTKLAVNVADPIREFWGSFSPTNGYRCKRLNGAVGGARSSKHMQGKAMDETFVTKEGKNASQEVFFWLLENKDTCKWTKIIWEFGNTDCPNWLHIEFDEEEQRKGTVLVKFELTPYLDYYSSSLYAIHKNKGFVK